MFEKMLLDFKRPRGWIKGFSKTNSLFIHIPKAAGTSISHALYDEDPWHYTPASYEFLSKSLTEKLFKFTFVRNPYTRLASTYKYSFKQVEVNPNTSIEFITKYGSFEDFIMNGLTRELINSHYFLRQQAEYVTNFKNEISFDFIGKFERLEHDFTVVKNKLGLNCSLSNSNKSPQNISTVYNHELAKVVYSLYRPDFEMFKYQKDSYLYLR